MAARGRVQSFYVALALLVLNTTLLFAALNGIACGARSLWRDARRPERLDLLGPERLRALYPGWSDADLEELFREDAVESDFEPFTHFRPRERSGRFVTVLPAGFRRSAAQRAWPPPPGSASVFVFGGSTTYGAGLADEETIPSRLQQALEECRRDAAVFNFGRPHYFSTQERVLFEQLVASGHAPAVAVFFDGLNDFFHWDGVPHGSETLAAAVAHARDADGAGAAALDLVRRLPLVRVAAAVARSGDGAAPAQGAAPPLDDAATSQAVIERWSANARFADAVARASGSRARFVWQPVPTHRYDLRAHALARGELGYFRAHQRSHYGYARMEQVRDALSLPPDVLWLDGIQEGRAESLYVDAVHYTAAFSREIAERIAEHLVRQGAIRCDSR